jgi:hypothetical protein
VLIPKESLFNDQFSCRVFAFCQFGFNLEPCQKEEESWRAKTSPLYTAQHSTAQHSTAQLRPNYITGRQLIWIAKEIGQI